MKHKHADLMIAYANDTSLEFEWRRDNLSPWWPVREGAPSFFTECEYRIKPTKDRALKLAEEVRADITSLYELGETDVESFNRVNTLVKLLKQL